MVAVVRIDKQGRILIPASVRKAVRSELFIVEFLNGEIRLKPVKQLDLTSLFDSVEVVVDDFTDTHKLRRALAEGK